VRGKGVTPNPYHRYGSAAYVLNMYSRIPVTHKNTNNVFRLIHPIYNRNPYIFKVHVFTKQATSGIESRIVFSAPRIQHVGSADWVISVNSMCVCARV